MTGAARPPAETTADASQAPASARASSYTRSHPLGIVAGGGGLPREIAEAVVAAGGAVQLVGLGGEVDGDIGHLPHAIVGWGQIGRLIATLKKAGCRDVLIIGHVRRPDIGRIRPDLGFFLNLASILRLRIAGGDDSVLRLVVRFFEGHGFRVVGIPDVAPGLMAPQGAVAVPDGAAAGDGARPVGSPDAHASVLPPVVAARSDIGFAVISALGPFDVGQGVVLAGDRIAAIEGAEGTDRLMARVGARVAAGEIDAGAGLTLIKGAKPGQELRVDLPVIGPATISGAVAARISTVIVEAGRAIIADRDHLVGRARDAGCAVYGARPSAKASRPAAARHDGAASQKPPVPFALRLATRRVPPTEVVTSAARGLATLEALAPFVASRGAAVIRRHVLALETGEGTLSMLTRVAGLRQWGDQRRGKRRGVAILHPGDDAADALVAAASGAGLACLCLAGDWREDDAMRLTEAAEAAGLSVVHCDQPTG